MQTADYFSQLGFVHGSPFESVNARDETERLGDYFVPPPFFESLYGNPKSPNSAIVLAPTGGGKTALSVMVEERAAGLEPSDELNRLPLLTVLYDDYSRLGLSQNSSELEDHLSAINYLLVIALLKAHALCPFPALRLSNDDRGFYRYAFAKYAGGRAGATVYEDLEKLRTGWERLQANARTLVGTIPVLGSIVKFLELGAEIGLDKLSAAKAVAESVVKTRRETRQFDAPAEVDFHKLVERLTTHYYEGIYILVDRVDETPWTVRDADAAYEFIHPLLSNLGLLDYPDRTFAFKFFLWDGIRDRYLEKARDDRIFFKELVWSPSKLLEMLNARLRAFSDGKVQDIRQLSVPGLAFGSHDLDFLLRSFSGSSPRTIVTLCKMMFEVQLDRLNRGETDSFLVEGRSVEIALDQFAGAVSRRLIPEQKAHREITSIGSVTFTTKSLHGGVFRGQSEQSVRSKVGKTWRKFEVLLEVGSELTGKQGYPARIFGFKNPAIAFLAAGVEVGKFLDSKVRMCDACGVPLVRDFGRGGSFQCHVCSHNFDTERVVPDAERRRSRVFRSTARAMAREIRQLSDIELLCDLAGLGLGKTSFRGSPFLIWLRVLEHVSTQPEAARELVAVLEDAVEGDTWRALLSDLLGEFEVSQ